MCRNFRRKQKMQNMSWNVQCIFKHRIVTVYGATTAILLVRETTVFSKQKVCDVRCFHCKNSMSSLCLTISSV
ncbi:hypothetical protein L596_015559 [Steinernema carpocapsae]|uniref:Uncharacterized protein n=1 Tax=Steinernema carpocapsae TaxID=34508 RepID=A0A4U5NFZ5_STECR|nr:hypothetical protein L596_015559 [Steinernema carpocapsae]